MRQAAQCGATGLSVVLFVSSADRHLWSTFRLRHLAKICQRCNIKLFPFAGELGVLLSWGRGAKVIHECNYGVRTNQAHFKDGKKIWFWKIGKKNVRKQYKLVSSVFYQLFSLPLHIFFFSVQYQYLADGVTR